MKDLDGNIRVHLGAGRPAACVQPSQGRAPPALAVARHRLLPSHALAASPPEQLRAMSCWQGHMHDCPKGLHGEKEHHIIEPSVPGKICRGLTTPITCNSLVALGSKLLA